MSPSIQNNSEAAASPLPDNNAIADQFALLAKLMDIHGENAFKAKSYAAAAFAIEKWPQPLSQLNGEQISKLKGLGESAAKKVMELLQTGELQVLQEIIQQTPPGVLEMMHIKGLGPKKIHTIWKEMAIDTISALEEACRENRIASQKGFGEKTQQKILEAIAFVHESKGSYLYKQVEEFVMVLQAKLEREFPNDQTMVTGQFRRQLETIDKLEWITTASKSDIKNYLHTDEGVLASDTDEEITFQTSENTVIKIHFATPENWGTKLFETSCSAEFLASWPTQKIAATSKREEDIFQDAGLPYLPPYLRESGFAFQKFSAEDLNSIVQTNSIKGLIHSHSNWSDGGHTIEEMAEELIRRGFEYMVISDHSKSAFYANGLNEVRIREQHRLIDDLNQILEPFKIFKSIECDILGDGSLDYDDQVLSSFDLVIASIHSNLDMDEEKAMMRLMGAITNPHTTILGHLTGRLLLRRKGYPVNHKTIIDACAEHNVAIEINASPSRLDMDWRWIEYAKEKGVLLSINPDAHLLEHFEYIKYGTLVAQKGALQASQNLSSFSLQDFEAYLQQTKMKKRATKKEA